MKILNSHLYSLIVVVSSLCFSSACIVVTAGPSTAELGTHLVTVKPQCDFLSTTAHNQTEKDGTDRVLYYELACGDTTALIRDNTLTVNGKSYGTLIEGDEIAINYGKVRVNSKVREEVK